MKKGKKKILIVDDDESILKVFTRILQKQGYETDTAKTGKEALEKCKTRFFNLALIDIKLPDIDGTELLEQLNKNHPDMIKIMITGYPSTNNHVKSLNMGAAAYLIKPINPDDLLETLKKKLKKKKAEN
ncbi:MAG: response regulator [Candidatus Lokiarchaeia archaeon]